MIRYKEKRGDTMVNYNTVFSDRRSISLSIRNGVLTVRAPYGTDKKTIEKLLLKHEAWIIKHLAKNLEKEDRFSNLTEDEVKNLKLEAKVYFENKTKHFAKIMGLKYGRMTITSAKTRFGSCSSAKNICFSYRLMLYPEKAREYVIVHELCHLVHMNHSRQFYALLESYLPDYKERKRLLK